MSLDWNVSKVKDYENVCKMVTDEGEICWRSETEALVWLAMAVGIPRITEENKDEFFDRVNKWEKVHGSMRFGGPEDPKGFYITKDDVYRHVGLSTNASPKTKAKFKKELAEDALEIALKK